MLDNTELMIKNIKNNYEDQLNIYKDKMEILETDLKSMKYNNLSLLKQKNILSKQIYDLISCLNIREEKIIYYKKIIRKLKRYSKNNGKKSKINFNNIKRLISNKSNNYQSNLLNMKSFKTINFDISNKNIFKNKIQEINKKLEENSSAKMKESFIFSKENDLNIKKLQKSTDTINQLNLIKTLNDNEFKTVIKHINIEDLYIVGFNYNNITEIINNIQFNKSIDNINPEIIFSITDNNINSKFNIENFFTESDFYLNYIQLEKNKIVDFFTNILFKQTEEKVHFCNINNEYYYFINFYDFINLENSDQEFNFLNKFIFIIKSKFPFLKLYKKFLKNLITSIKIKKIDLFNQFIKSKNLDKNYYKIAFNYMSYGIKFEIKKWVNYFNNINLKIETIFNFKYFDKEFKVEIPTIQKNVDYLLLYTLSLLNNYINYDLILLGLIFIIYEYNVLVISKKNELITSYINYLLNLISNKNIIINYFISPNDILNFNSSKHFIFGINLNEINNVKKILTFNYDFLEKPLLFILLDYNSFNFFNDANNQYLQFNIDLNLSQIILNNGVSNFNNIKFKEIDMEYFIELKNKENKLGDKKLSKNLKKNLKKENLYNYNKNIKNYFQKKIFTNDKNVNNFEYFKKFHKFNSYN